MPAPKGVDASAPAWLVTFGDLNSLLLCFFVLLFSLSDVKKDKTLEVVESLGKAFGLEGVHEKEPGSPTKLPTLKQIILEISSPARFAPVKGRGGTQVPSPFGRHTKVAPVRDGLKIIIGGKVTFPEGKAELIEEGRHILNDMAGYMQGLPNAIEIRGHASTGPIAAETAMRYRDDPHGFQLGYDRAKAVAEFLISTGRIPRERIRLSSAGRYESIRDNVFEAGGRSMNDRVELIVLAR